MSFNFDISKTASFRSFKLWSFPLFKYASVLSQFCFGLFIFSLLLPVFFFLQFIDVANPLALPAILLCMSLWFWELGLFTRLKIQQPGKGQMLSKDSVDVENDNIAEVLSLQSSGMVEKAIKESKKRKLLGVSSELLFYFLLRKSRDCQLLMFRLGLDAKKLEQELKNYLEKQKKQQQFSVSLSESFQKTIKEAARVAMQRQSAAIGEKELLVALAKHDEFFKKVLVEHDLKEKDIENITLWLDNRSKKIAQSKKFWAKENLATMGSLGRDFASGFTITLDRFCIDWRKIVSRDIFSEIIGHEKEIDEVEIILAKSRLANVLIVGEVGVGRKSIVQALAKRCFLATGLSELAGKRVVELNMVQVLSQIQDVEKLEATLDQIFSEVLAAGNVILVIDEIENFVEQNTQKLGGADISAILAKYLAIPQFHFIGIASLDGLHRKLERNTSFLEYFTRIEVSEISELETIVILQNLALSLEKKYSILITYPAIREIINLTGRYFPSTPFPKKAIDVLEEAAIYVSNIKDMALARHYIKAVNPSHIAKIISDKTKIPMGKMEFKEKSVLLNLENLIHQRIIGQDDAVNEISIAMRRARSGLSSKKRPMGVFLFLGPTGVGKTETAKALAEIYFGGEDKMARLDMSEFQETSDIWRLIGRISPVEEQGLLTTPVRENPFSLVLLDEIEKAHPNILNLFLQVFDEGHITDGQGRKVIFTNTIIICTSNAGAQMVFKEVQAGNKVEKNKLFSFLFEKAIFKPEFINRFDAAVFFNSLTRDDLLQIAQLNLAGLQKNLKEQDIDFVITEALKAKIVEMSYKPEFGAREMRRVIQNNVENVVAQALLSDKIIKGDRIEMNAENFEIMKRG